MIKITYNIIVPGGLTTIPETTPDELAFNEATFIWSCQNGLADVTTEDISSNEKSITYLWSSQADLDAFYAHFGEAYTKHYALYEAQIELLGGSITRITENV
jgi:hypothetical protein